MLFSSVVGCEVRVGTKSYSFLIDNCKLLLEDARNFNFASLFLQNGRDFSPKFCIFGTKFSDSNNIF